MFPLSVSSKNNPYVKILSALLRTGQCGYLFALLSILTPKPLKKACRVFFGWPAGLAPN